MRIDPRAGSGDLAPLLRARGVKEVELATMYAGDVAITGNGPGGCPVQVGVEVKKLGDMIQCMETGRFMSHQLPAMLDTYDRIWLLVEGIHRTGDSGLLEVPRGASWSAARGGPRGSGLMSTAFHGYLLTLSEKLNVKVQLTGTRRQTVDWLYQLNRWWTHKEYDDHKAHLTFDNSAALSLVSRPSLVRRVAKELPGIGWDRSGNVARTFSSVVELVMADQGEWQAIDGIGKTTAAKVVRALQGEAD